MWNFKFTEIELKVSQITQDDDINSLHKEGFENFYAGLEEFLTENEVTLIRIWLILKYIQARLLNQQILSRHQIIFMAENGLVMYQFLHWKKLNGMEK